VFGVTVAPPGVEGNIAAGTFALVSVRSSA